MIEFHPHRLAEALERVQKEHTSRRGDTPKINKSVVDEVRETLSQVEFANIDKIIFHFDLKRLLACLEIVSVDRDGDIADKAAYAVKMRPKEAMITVAWFKLIKNYPHPLLEFLLNELIKEKGGNSIEKHPKISNHAIRWLMDSDLARGILKDYRTVPENPDFDEYLKKHFLIEQESLYGVAWQNLLMKGAAVDIIKQKSGRILEIIDTEIKSSTSIQMGQNYLNELKFVKNWDESIITYINKKWDRPIIESNSSISENRFWNDVSEQAREEFHSWLMLKAIDDFFEGERADFWRVYVKQAKMMDVQKILDGDGFLMAFRTFGVIEFKNVGNAAYIYPKIVFNSFISGSKRWATNPSYFKNKSTTARLKSEPWWDGRIIHRDGWQILTAEKIEKLIAQK
jgi:hypothetical protein